MEFMVVHGLPVRRPVQAVMAAVLALPAGLLVADCKSEPKGSEGTSARPSSADAALQSAFTPADLPDPKIAGYAYPEPAKTVEVWATSNDVDALARHVWGLWTALTMDSGQSFEGLPLRVFETWFTIDDLESATPLKGASRRRPRPLGELEQLARGRESAKKNRLGPPSAKLAPSGTGTASPGPDPRQAVGERELAGFIKFNPAAAEHIARNDLFSTSALTALVVDSGDRQIAPFPDNSIVIKAIYATFSTTTPGPFGTDAANPAAPYALFPVWTGPPDAPVASPPTSWKACVWIDLLDTTDGPATGAVDTTCDPSGASRTLATTYGLGRFLHFTLTASEAPPQKVPTGTTVGAEANVGDIVVLAGMHVTTRETAGWTWSTFFWTPSPDAPPFPSTPAFTAQRPAELTGAPRSYASCAVLAMQLPAQPLTGGATDGESLYCYNPYLEGQFGPAVLPDSRPGSYQGKTVPNDVGSQSNCMACHAQATFAPPGKTAPGYAGDRYVDLAGSEFDGVLQTDFLWSVPDTAMVQ
jgi:hypothetical protein